MLLSDAGMEPVFTQPSALSIPVGVDLQVTPYRLVSIMSRHTVNGVLLMKPRSHFQSLAKRIRGLMETDGIHRNQELGVDYYSSYSDLYDWELYFDSILLAYYGGERFAIEGLRIFFRKQQENGFIPRRVPKHPVSEDLPPLLQRIFDEERREHCKPFLFQIALLVSRMSGSSGWLTTEDYQALRGYLLHWFAAWDQDGNGLCEWNSAPHSGSDTQIERIGSWRSRFCEGTDLNCFLYRECLAAVFIAEALGHADDAALFKKHADSVSHGVRSMLWNESEGIFYDRDARDGRVIRVRSAATFLPLAVGIATPDQARALVERHLRNPDEFLAPFPVPSYARSEPAYTQYFMPAPDLDPLYALGPGHANWCGGMWPHWNIQISHGLAQYGFTGEAELLAGRLLDAVSAPEGFYEWYDAETGKGCGLNPFWAGATVLGAMLPVELGENFDPMTPAPVAERLNFDPVREFMGIIPDFQPARINP